MSLAKPLRTLSNFDTEDPAELARQLSQLEQNVDDAVRSTVASSVAPFQPTSRVTAAYVASIDQLVRVDTVSGNVAVTLPIATVKNAGRTVAIARMSASNTLTVAPVQGTVNGAASLALTAAVRLFFLVSDGVGWWSTA